MNHNICVALACYIKKEWGLWKASSHDFEDTYEEWLGPLKQRIIKMRVDGVSPKKAILVYADFLQYCQQHGLENNFENRSRYAAKLAEAGQIEEFGSEFIPEKINIELNRQQLKGLLNLVYWGDWMVNSVRVKDVVHKYARVEQLILAYAFHGGLFNSVDFDKDSGEYFPSRSLESDSEINQYIDEYDNFSFWEELIDRLVQRDMSAHYGADRLRKMNLKERFEKEGPIEEKYESEFEEHGIERLQIIDLTAHS